MAYRFQAPPASQQKTQMTSNTSPTFSTLGRSPSIGPPAYTTDDLQAARNEEQARWLHLMRIAIAAITLGTSIAVISCIAVSLKAYSDSHLGAEWLLPLWPLHVDLRPSHTVLGCGTTISVFSLVYLAAAFIPMPRKLHNLNIISSIFSFLALFATLFTTIYASDLTNNLADSTSSGTLNSWTCKWQGLDSAGAPARFIEICNEGTAALDLVIFLAIVEVLAVGATAWGWWIETRMKRVSVEGGKDEIQLV
ncbi:hypothetical protein OEA41_000200 [Lepraria neglecta]|uniref:Uncharacterized protein n=1 Tax=Lepraria neglecta TaxID=209136 RepID=A0AAD9ZG65_9LECA|nr:hypothetical protein OEA41_000200 [Lepraria neglecta]